MRHRAAEKMFTTSPNLLPFGCQSAERSQMNQRSPSAVRRLKRAQTRIAASAEMRAGTHMHRHAVYKQERFDGHLLIFPDLQHLQVNVWRASADDPAEVDQGNRSIDGFI